MVDFVARHFEIVSAEHALSVTLKPEQSRIINTVCNQKDVFVCLPTGFGKTLCMVLPPLLLNKVN